MPLTKSKAIEAFIHVLDNVFEAPEDGPLSKALEHAGYSNIWDLVTLCNEDIELLTFDKSDKVKDVSLGRAHQSLLCILHYCDHQNCLGTTIGDNWTSTSRLMISMITVLGQIMQPYDVQDLQFHLLLEALPLIQLEPHPLQWRISSVR